jgi:hypothetical protein
MTEQHSQRSHPEQVVLEIGGEIGALVVYTDAGLHGAEIEISPTGDDDHRAHKDVLNRPVNGRATYAAVFDGLGDGSYTLWIRDVSVATDVSITGGCITELDWRGAAPSVRALVGGHAH